MLTLIYVILAALGLSFLVFIHELGHYVVAKRVGMRVEVFSIGFGKPIFTWMRGDVKWQVCYLLFGGYVKIAGMDKEGDKEPHQIEGGFFSKSPWDRIQVALMGPVVNIVFAFVAFTLIFLTGGREQEFHQQTRVVGYVDTGSDLYEKGLRSGDVIHSIGGEEYHNFMDLTYSLVADQESVSVEGEHVNYFTGERTPFQESVKPYPNPRMGADFKTIGIGAPANFLVYEGYPIPEGAPMADSGIQKGDRIVWADGELVFSIHQLREAAARNTALLTIKRGGDVLLERVPRVAVGDLRLSRHQADEFDDWFHEMGLEGNVKDALFIPFALENDCTVSGTYMYLDGEARHKILEKSLQVGDRILAVDGSEVVTPFQLLGKIQKRKLLMIVHSDTSMKPFSWRVQDKRFEESFDGAQLSRMVAAIGIDGDMKAFGQLRMLNPISPVRKIEFPRSEGRQKAVELSIAEAKERVKAIKDPKEKADLERRIEAFASQGTLGIAFVDHPITFNPSPFALVDEVLGKMRQTFVGLFSGQLKPKWLSGPVGIVTVMHHSWSLGFNEALYWLGLISLNLGVLNLLPIPVLDGGHIVFALYEIVTRRRIKASIMEKMVLPFVVLLILFLVYVTIQDVSRLFIH